MKNQIRVVTLVAVLCGGLSVRAADRQSTPKANVATSAQERAVAALRAERVKFDGGKSSLFNVCKAAKDLRNSELETSANAPQRIAAHKRHVAVLRELKVHTEKGIEKGVLAPLDGKLVAQQFKEAEAELLRAVTTE